VCLSVGQAVWTDGPQFGNRWLTVLYTTQQSVNHSAVGNHYHQFTIVVVPKQWHEGLHLATLKMFRPTWQWGNSLGRVKYLHVYVVFPLSRTSEIATDIDNSNKYGYPPPPHPPTAQYTCHVVRTRYMHRTGNNYISIVRRFITVVFQQLNNTTKRSVNTS
jgi:hypothetical protein